MTYSVFLATAMEHQLPERVDFLAKLAANIEAKFGVPYYAPKLWPDPKDYPPPGEAFQIIRDALSTSKCFVLYYPDRVPSGALVELGMAISRGIPTLIYTEDLQNITYFLRESIQRVMVSTRQEDIWPWLQRQFT